MGVFPEKDCRKTNLTGDYAFPSGKWKGMVFHPYSLENIGRLTSGHVAKILVESESGYTVVIDK